VPVVKTAATVSKNKKIGILSTKRTAESDYQKRLIEKFATGCEVVNVGTNVVVPMVESGDVDMTVLQEELQPFQKAGIDTIALGCTHFPFVKQQIQEVVGKNVHILDSGEAIARQVQRVLQQEGIESESVKGNHKFYTTGDEEQFRAQLTRLVALEPHVTIKTIDI
jgi:glutamate racemase